jgi:hypothetical protein
LREVAVSNDVRRAAHKSQRIQSIVGRGFCDLGRQAICELRSAGICDPRSDGESKNPGVEQD